MRYSRYTQTNKESYPISLAESLVSIPLAFKTDNEAVRKMLVRQIRIGYQEKTLLRHLKDQGDIGALLHEQN